MFERNFIVKNAENFSEHNAKNFAENSFPLPINRQNTEMISLFITSLTMFTQSQIQSNFVGI